MGVICHEKWSFWRFSKFLIFPQIFRILLTSQKIALKSSFFNIFRVCKRLKLIIFYGQQEEKIKNCMSKAKIWSNFAPKLKNLKNQYFWLFNFEKLYLQKYWFQWPAPIFSRIFMARENFWVVLDLSRPKNDRDIAIWRWHSNFFWKIFYPLLLHQFSGLKSSIFHQFWHVRGLNVLEFNQQFNGNV